MKRNLTFGILFLSAGLLITGCDFIGGIFKTGVGVGVFIAVVVVLIIVALISRGRRRM